MGEFETIAKLIGDYGALVVLAALGIWIVIKNMTKKDKLSKSDEVFKKELSAYIISQLKNSVDHAHGDEEKSSIDKNLQTNNILQQLLMKTKVDRVLLFMYHNGVVDYTGRSLQKMSCTAEAHQCHLVPMQPAYQNFLRTFFMYLYKKLSNQKELYIDNIDILKSIDQSTYHYFNTRGAHCVYIINIMNMNNQPVGILSISSSFQVENLDYCKKELKVAGHKIEGIYSIKEEK